MFQASKHLPLNLPTRGASFMIQHCWVIVDKDYVTIREATEAIMTRLQYVKRNKIFIVPLGEFNLALINVYASLLLLQKIKKNWLLKIYQTILKNLLAYQRRGQIGDTIIVAKIINFTNIWTNTMTNRNDGLAKKTTRWCQ